MERSGENLFLNFTSASASELQIMKSSGLGLILVKGFATSMVELFIIEAGNQ